MAHGHSAASTGGSHGSFSSYATGFVLSVILTAIPFYLVMHPVLAPGATIATILALGVVQIFVHLVFFLHLSVRGEKGWDVTAFLFTALITLVLIVGSVWIIWNMHHYMMVH